MATTGLLSRRHIQDFHSGQPVEHHWGYADRIVPCTNDAGSCAYLDSVYHSHDLGMMYTWILWTVLGFVFVSLIALRFFSFSSKTQGSPRSRFKRAYSAISAGFRRHLLPETRLPGFWNHTTRLQVLILAIFLAYLLVFSFVGIAYKHWVTPVKTNPSLHNLRSGLGPWSDRVGVLAYALTPLVVFLSARESILSLATGIPSQHFLFLHAWTGRVIFIQSFLHTLGWTLVEGRFYQPQPKEYITVISEQYIIFGIVAMFLLTVLYIFSMKTVIARTGHEVFRKVHYLVALLYLGACWGHWVQLACWMIASLIVVLLDRFVRLARIAWIHTSRADGTGNGLLDIHPFQANVSTFTDATDGRTVVRLDVTVPPNQKKKVAWRPGQHFYVCFPELSVWQSHPFTVANVQQDLQASAANTAEDMTVASGDVITFILRTHKGQTSLVLEWTKAQSQSSNGASRTLSIVLTGPYGVPVLNPKRQQNVLALAAGTGVTYTLPLAIQAASSVTAGTSAVPRQVEHIWIMREARDLAWLPERDTATVRRLVAEGKLLFRVFVTQEADTGLAAGSEKASSIESSAADGDKQPSANLTAIASHVDTQYLADLDIVRLGGARPDLASLVAQHISERADAALPSQVVASGPAGMLADVRQAVARVNHADRVWRGELKWDVELWCDDRLD